MKLWQLLVFSLFLTACSTAGTPTSSSLSSDQESTPPTSSDPEAAQAAAALPPGVELENLGPAPELHNEVWLNTDQPLRLADLRGQVVLIDMWTFG